MQSSLIHSAVHFEGIWYETW